MLAEQTDGLWTNYLWFGNELVGLVRNGNVVNIYNDHLGRPEYATDSNQSVVWKAYNYAYGRSVTQDSIGGLNIGFPGQYYDAETGLWYNGFRDYDAESGRYVQSDPIGIGGGINTYAYGDGNPVSNTDTLGLQSRALSRAPVGQATSGKQEAYGGPLIRPDAVLVGALSRLTTMFPMIQITANGVLALKPPKDAADPNGGKAPGLPTESDGYCPGKNGPEWARNPNGRGAGWKDKDGKVWVPTGFGGAAHGGPHWDV